MRCCAGGNSSRRHSPWIRTGAAYLQRAEFAAYENLAAAEKDYRRGLELSPNSAKGYAGLAAVVYATPSRRDEVLELLDRARKLDPLEPGHDVIKAQFLWFERADLQGANALLVDVLKRNPRYKPALGGLGGLRPLMKQAANAIRYSEQALALDPSLEMDASCADSCISRSGRPVGGQAASTA